MTGQQIMILSHAQLTGILIIMNLSNGLEIHCINFIICISLLLSCVHSPSVDLNR
jgi:hypothetical protein